MLRTLNWSGIAFGVGAGLILGLVLSAVVAGRFSLVGAIAAGGFAGLLLYFGLAVFAIIAGTELSGVALVFFGLLALAFGSAGALLAEAPRRRR
mgnify:CR=1 FL=1